VRANRPAARAPNTINTSASEIWPTWAAITATTRARATATPIGRHSLGAHIPAHSKASNTAPATTKAQNQSPPAQPARTAAGASTTAEAARRAMSRGFNAISDRRLAISGVHDLAPDIATLATGELGDGLGQGFSAVVRPEDVLENHLGVSRLPQQEVGQA